MISFLRKSTGAHKGMAFLATLSILLVGGVSAEAVGLGLTAHETVGATQPSQDVPGTAVCHLPGGNVSKGKTLVVDDEELAEHIHHGDLLGPCANVTSVQTGGAGTHNDRTAVCHLPGGGSGKAKTLHLDDEGLAEHLAHGDSLGACENASVSLLVPAGKVAVCHMPGGRSTHAKTLVVGDEALADHLGHGDTAGECPASLTARDRQLGAFCDRKPDHRRCE